MYCKYIWYLFIMYAYYYLLVIYIIYLLFFIFMIFILLYYYLCIITPLILSMLYLFLLLLQIMKWIADVACPDADVYLPLCGDILMLLTGPDSKQLNEVKHTFTHY